MRILTTWSHAEYDSEEALARAVRDQRDPDEAAVGLATVSRLLAIELAAASGRSERAVIGDLEAMIRSLQGPRPR
ncbi:hypothetical protein V1Y59_01290 [Gordonia sp. PKS22-38]|uniref:Uncharacterized protein n=1 Tax=Gordonia prachuapensis TaxID=3115651 RepID=A0ABU7MN13_9ACTN|nr:hypothetical protein [Gordonia sp. PKS22-38]